MPANTERSFDREIFVPRRGFHLWRSGWKAGQERFMSGRRRIGQYHSDIQYRVPPYISSSESTLDHPYVHYPSPSPAPSPSQHPTLNTTSKLLLPPRLPHTPYNPKLLLPPPNP